MLRAISAQRTERIPEKEFDKTGYPFSSKFSPNGKLELIFRV